VGPVRAVRRAGGERGAIAGRGSRRQPPADARKGSALRAIGLTKSRYKGDTSFEASKLTVVAWNYKDPKDRADARDVANIKRAVAIEEMDDVDVREVEVVLPNGASRMGSGAAAAASSSSCALPSPRPMFNATGSGTADGAAFAWSGLDVGGAPAHQPPLTRDEEDTRRDAPRPRTGGAREDRIPFSLEHKYSELHVLECCTLYAKTERFVDEWSTLRIENIEDEFQCASRECCDSTRGGRAVFIRKTKLVSVEVTGKTPLNCFQACCEFWSSLRCECCVMYHENGSWTGREPNYLHAVFETDAGPPFNPTRAVDFHAPPSYMRILLQWFHDSNVNLDGDVSASGGAPAVVGLAAPVRVTAPVGVASPVSAAAPAGVAAPVRVAELVVPAAMPPVSMPGDADGAVAAPAVVVLPAAPPPSLFGSIVGAVQDAAARVQRGGGGARDEKRGSEPAHPESGVGVLMDQEQARIHRLAESLIAFYAARSGERLNPGRPRTVDAAEAVIREYGIDDVRASLERSFGAVPEGW